MVMTNRVTLTIKNGSLAGRRFEFETAQYCTIGRASDCDVKLPTDFENSTVSRHHCLLDISPPEVNVRDCGSRNGTKINGMQIGHPGSWYLCTAPCTPLPEYQLHDGDELRVADVIFHVTVRQFAEEAPELVFDEAECQDALACV
jgi:pSer/pThr/pTyr-binding forkhead associated (FHA) protein